MSSRMFSTAFTLRKRLNWESLDAGILLWRRNFPAVFLSVLVPCLSTALITRWIFPNTLIISWIAVWWLKPFYDRIIIYILGDRFFLSNSRSDNAVPKTRIFTGLLHDITWRRFSIMRSVRLPARMLEGVKGQTIRKRFKALARGGLDFGALLTAASLTIEILLITSEAVFVLSMIGMVNPEYLYIFTGNTELIEKLLFSVFCLNIICIEGLYSAMGFGLYINSRIEVEGWDIQFLFRSLSLERKSKASKTALLLLLSASSLIFLPDNAYAQEFKNILEPSAAVPSESLEEILTSPDFGGTRKQWALRLREAPENRSDLELPEINPDWELIRDIFGYVLIAVIVGAVLALCYVLYTVLKKNRLFFPKGKDNSDPEYSTSVYKTFDPQRALAEADTYLSKGLLRKAWALSVQTALNLAAIRSGAEFQTKSTELELLGRVKKAGINDFDDLASFIHTWLGIAYAGKTPPKEDCERCIAWCRYQIPGNTKEQTV